MDSKELGLELQKEVELNIEKDRLKEIINVINKETLNYINKRKEIAKYILDYRKKFVEDYKDDEDKLIEYFDHERFAKEETFNLLDKRLKELTNLSSSPYFGRVDFIEEDSQYIDKIYIGRFGLTPEDTYEPLIVDWRAPVSSLFYTSSLGETCYKAPMESVNVDILLKRQFIIKKQKLLGMFNSAFEVKDDILQMVLSKNTEDKLKDIVMTIQEEQDKIIRMDKNKIIVVNGVAGSGKTTIALHRVAYLLYNFRKTLENKVLILGPNNIFMEYISNVLPSLGESGVIQETFVDFSMNILNLSNIMDFGEYMELVLNGEEEFIQEIKYKNSVQFIKELDKLIKGLDTIEEKAKDIVLEKMLVIDKEEIIELCKKYYNDMPLYKRNKKVKRIIFSRIKDTRDKFVREIQKEYMDKIAAMSEKELEQYSNALDLQRKIKIRHIIKEVIKVKQLLDWLNPKNSIDIYKSFNNYRQLTMDDLAPMLYLKVKLEGYKLKSEIKHIVIDEAQDYSALQFMVIKEITKCNSMTIVGDSNQKIIPSSEEPSMNNLDNILENVNVENFALNKSYRSTTEIMKYANKYLEGDSIIPLVRSGEKVEEELIDSRNLLINKLENRLLALKEQGFENIAVICKDLDNVYKYCGLLKEKGLLKIINTEDVMYRGGTIAIPSYFSKGMEFDAVILIKNEKENLDSSKLNYVMVTRALHKLCVYSIK